jgi:PAS domain S-box-containing protein
MTQLSVRSVSRTPAATASASSRLQLLEYYLAHQDDLAGCAQASLDWLARHAGVKRSICLAVDTESSLLLGFAGVGVRSEDVELFAWPVTHSHDPLTAALAHPIPTSLRFTRANGDGRGSHAPPFGSGPFTAIPLRGDPGLEGDATGLLLVKAGTPLTPDVNWLVTVLAQKIEQIRGRGSLAEEARKLRRERALFFTIINSVTDPILLTDTEGRLIVANARAEKLFAASEEESEGRRRAVELNNMLFSAALSRTAVETPSEARELLLVDPSDGSDLLFEVLSTTVEDPREGTGIVSVLRNITDLRRATEQIEETTRSCGWRKRRRVPSGIG